jgi:SAM-dependent methyltransferase
MSYNHEKRVTDLSGPSKIVEYLYTNYEPKSVIDIGCGLGAWLQNFQEKGVKHIFGIDGSWINREDLYIDSQYFLEADLRKDFALDNKFDLLLCLEVAEHLEEKYAENLISNLTKMSDMVVFSAAIPGQGGQNHFNEQPPQYWLGVFDKFGFYLYEDFRDKFWNELEIDWWYKQNILVFKRNESPEGSIEIELTYKIHYELWERELKQKNSIWRKLMDTNQGKISWRQLFKIIYRKLTNYHQKVNRDS